jgi:asparagine synthase (glutamine-hydrolysing)
MCGIAGYVAAEGSFPNRELLKRMCDRIVHRGPDAYGEYLDSEVALGHRRLSIIDLAGGNQPLGNEDGQVQVVFNGEIYNYRPLRADLERKGHHFQTNSDTEVLVHLWEEEGERMPEFLNGMFAFAIWDRARRQLFLARDRFGKKPLYYSESIADAAFAFASELKALRAMPGFDLDADPRAVSDFLCLGYVPDPRSIYLGAEKLAPGHSLLWSAASGVRIRKYWELVFDPDESLRFEEESERIRELCIDAVQCRLMSDVPLGAFLSGGVDSSTVVAIMARHAPDRVKSFSIGFTNKNFDELNYARLLVERYKTDHREEVVTPSIHGTLDTLVEHYDEPFGDASAIPTLYLSRMTRQHVTVALSGDGGDEIFGGYNRYTLGMLENRLRTLFPGWFRRSVIATAAQYYPKLDVLPRPLRWKAMLTCVSQELADGYFTSVSAFRDAQLDAILAPELRRRLGGYSTREWFAGLFRDVSHLPPLEQMQAIDVKTYLPGDILVKVDRASMAYSLEARSPLLDYRVGEAAARLPSAFKVRGQSGKMIFKHAFAPYLPPVTTTRAKMGFSVPMAEWFRTSLKSTFESVVLHPAMEEYVSPGEVRKIWNDHQGGLKNEQTRLWYLLMLACWVGRHHHASHSEGWLEEALAR